MKSIITTYNGKPKSFQTVNVRTTTRFQNRLRNPTEFLISCTSQILSAKYQPDAPSSNSESTLRTIRTNQDGSKKLEISIQESGDLTTFFEDIAQKYHQYKSTPPTSNDLKFRGIVGLVICGQVELTLPSPLNHEVRYKIESTLQTRLLKKFGYVAKDPLQQIISDAGVLPNTLRKIQQKGSRIERRSSSEENVMKAQRSVKGSPDRAAKLNNLLNKAGFSEIQLRILNRFQFNVLNDDELAIFENRKDGYPDTQEGLQKFQFDLLKSISLRTLITGINHQHAINAVINTPNEKDNYNDSDASYHAKKAELNLEPVISHAKALHQLLQEAQNYHDLLLEFTYARIHQLVEKSNLHTDYYSPKEPAKLISDLTFCAVIGKGSNTMYQLPMVNTVTEQFRQKIEGFKESSRGSYSDEHLEKNLKDLIKSCIENIPYIAERFFTPEENKALLQLPKGNVIHCTKQNRTLQQKGIQSGSCLGTGLYLARHLNQQTFSNKKELKETIKGAYGKGVTHHLAYTSAYIHGTLTERIPSNTPALKGLSKVEEFTNFKLPVIQDAHPTAIETFNTKIRDHLKHNDIVGLLFHGHVIYLKLETINDKLHFFYIDPMNAGTYLIPTTATSKADFDFTKLDVDNPEALLKALVKEASMGTKTVQNLVLLNEQVS